IATRSKWVKRRRAAARSCTRQSRLRHEAVERETSSRICCSSAGSWRGGGRHFTPRGPPLFFDPPHHPAGHPNPPLTPPPPRARPPAGARRPPAPPASWRRGAGGGDFSGERDEPPNLTRVSSRRGDKSSPPMNLVLVDGQPHFRGEPGKQTGSHRHTRHEQ